MRVNAMFTRKHRMCRMRILLCVVAALLTIGAARAADLTVTVTSAGQPVADAVVMFRPAQASHAPIHFDWPMRIAQHNIQFEPHVLVVPVGAVVSFPNLDTVRHHVYSFSTGNRFELRLYGHDETRTVTFNTVGTAAIGCNIHDTMSAYVIVVDTPYAAKTDSSGQVRFTGASGAGQLVVWDEFLRAPNMTQSVALTLPRDGEVRQAVDLVLRPAGAHQSMH